MKNLHSKKFDGKTYFLQFVYSIKRDALNAAHALKLKTGVNIRIVKIKHPTEARYGYGIYARG